MGQEGAGKSDLSYYSEWQTPAPPQDTALLHFSIFHPKVGPTH